jgi:predicted transcriptional regulator
VDREGLRRRGRRTLMHRMKYRSRTELIRDILQTARSDGNGVVKTKIMYNAFLSYHQVKEYLTILIDNGLLQHDLGNQKFRITEKGLRFLQLCDQIGDLMEEEQQRW